MSSQLDAVKGLDPKRAVDAILINSPLKDYDHQEKFNDFTLPVLGLGYIATYAKTQGLNIGVLDAEAESMGPKTVAQIVNKLSPRWAGFNLLAPTYALARATATELDPRINILLGGHHAKAMPAQICADPGFPRVDALVLGEGEYIVSELLHSHDSRKWLPGVWFREGEIVLRSDPASTSGVNTKYWTAPDINNLPFVDRTFLTQDPYLADDGRLEANFVGSRGCPYECSFCGAAKSANPDITIRTRDPDNIIDEMLECRELYDVSAVRFVDDLFLANLGFMNRMLPRLVERGIPSSFVWDATGRINTLAKADSALLNLLVQAGCREVALGIESGSDSMLAYIDKRLSRSMITDVVAKLMRHGISVKGYFIMGFPGESAKDLSETISLVEECWNIADRHKGKFRCSVFEFRPYPGTREWHRIIQSKIATEQDLLKYEHVDLTGSGEVSALLDRDEFNFSVNLQFSEVPLPEIRAALSRIMLLQKARLN